MAQVRRMGPESGGRTCRHLGKQSTEAWDGEGTAIHEGRGGTRGLSGPHQEVQLRWKDITRGFLLQESIRPGFAFGSGHSGNSDV